MTNEQREQFAREIVELARKFKVRSVAVQYRDGHRSESEMLGEHTIAWAEGRHGALDRINMSYRDTRYISERQGDAD